MVSGGGHVLSGSRSFFFCGVGGSGMMPLASLLALKGCEVSGSDRSRDQDPAASRFAALEGRGIRLFPQDGSGVSSKTGTLVVSSAVEEAIPDVQAARRLGIPVVSRADILAGLVNSSKSVAVGGTSGKTTVTAMIGVILQEAGFSPTVVNGGHMLDFVDDRGVPLGFHAGSGPWMVAETCESDGSIALYEPEVAIVNNISLDHKPLPELRALFSAFIGRARTGAVLNGDCPETRTIARPGDLLFGWNEDAALRAVDIRDAGQRPSFLVTYKGRSVPCTLNVPGMHNVSNALAAIGACVLAGVSPDMAASALSHFSGTKRRLERVGERGGIAVFDDFGHNPDKIAATLATLHLSPGRVLTVFQPHGFGPTRLMRDELVESFVHGLEEGDVLIMPEIFYAGGTAARDISSADIVRAVAERGRTALFIPDRDAIRQRLIGEARPGDRIVVMGARDDTLSAFAQDIVANLGCGTSLTGSA